MRYNQNTEITLDPTDISKLQNPEIGVLKRGSVIILYNPQGDRRREPPKQEKK